MWFILFYFVMELATLPLTTVAHHLEFSRVLLAWFFGVRRGYKAAGDYIRAYIDRPDHPVNSGCEDARLVGVCGALRAACDMCTCADSDDAFREFLTTFVCNSPQHTKDTYLAINAAAERCKLPLDHPPLIWVRHLFCVYEIAFLG
jgi:hypothetical protein